MASIIGKVYYPGCGRTRGNTGSPEMPFLRSRCRKHHDLRTRKDKRSRYGPPETEKRNRGRKRTAHAHPSGAVFTECILGTLKILLVDGGVCEDISVRNVIMKNVDGPVFIRLGKRGTFHRVYCGGYPSAEFRHLLRALKKTGPGSLSSVFPGETLRSWFSGIYRSVFPAAEPRKKPESQFRRMKPGIPSSISSEPFPPGDSTCVMSGASVSPTPPAIFRDTEDGELFMNNFEPEYRQ